MTVASTTNRKSFSGDGVTTSFGTSPVVFYESTDLVVQVFSSAGVATTLTEGAQYTVSGGSTTGATGTVNLAGGTSPYGAPAVGTTLLIRRVLPLVQEADFVNNDINDAEVSETALDKLTMMVQQLDEVDDRAVKLSSAEAGSAALTELPFDRASKFLAFDASKNIIASTGGMTGVPSDTVIQVVDTVAELKALTVPSSAVVYLTRGYYAAGDGGMGFYRWNAADTSTDNGGTVLVPDSAPAAGRWNLNTTGGVALKQFGDVTAEFNVASDANTETVSVQTLEIPFGGAIVFRNNGNTADAPMMSNESGEILCNREIRMRGPVGGQALFGVNNPTATDKAFATDTPGDAHNRFVVNCNGAMGWGPGSATQDFQLARTGVGLAQITGQGTSMVTFRDNTNAAGYAGVSFRGTGTQRYSVGIGGPSEATLGVADKFFVYDGVAGKMRITVATGGATLVCGGVAVPANGSSDAVLLMGVTAGFGIYFGSGAPTVSAGKGSLYLRNDGSGTGDRAYINQDGGTTWTALTTAS